MLPTISSTSYGKRLTIQGPLSLAPHPRPAGQGVAPSHMPANVASADNVGDLEDMRGAGEAGASEAAGCNADEGHERHSNNRTDSLCLEQGPESDRERRSGQGQQPASHLGVHAVVTSMACFSSVHML
jgi:hypothetical protein